MTDALPSSIKLSPIQREVLDQIVHVLTSTQDPVWPERAILLWGDGVSDSTTARELDVSEETVRILRHRWFSWMARIAAAEKKVHKTFAEIVSLIFQILSEEIAPETTLTASPSVASERKSPKPSTTDRLNFFVTRLSAASSSLAKRLKFPGDCPVARELAGTLHCGTWFTGPNHNEQILRSLATFQTGTDLLESTPRAT